MANTVDIQQELLRLVQAQIASAPSATALTAIAGPASGAPLVPTSPGPADAASDPVAALAAELEALRRQLGAAEETSRKQAEILDLNTRALLESTARSAASTVATVASGAVSSISSAGGLGFLANPIVGLFSWLLGSKSGSSSTPVLPTFSLPSAIDGNLGISSAQSVSPVTYGSGGVPRQDPGPAPVASGAANITVHVQTMDSRSFLDNSDQIARAVREAILNSHGLSDVIGEM